MGEILDIYEFLRSFTKLHEALRIFTKLYEALRSFTKLYEALRKKVSIVTKFGVINFFDMDIGYGNILLIMYYLFC